MPYINYSMSVNAQKAYDNGEMPLSKWTKTEILSAIEDVLKNQELLPLFKKLQKEALRDCFFKRTYWHHTSSYYNRTYFYSLDEEEVNNATAEKLKRIYNNYTKTTVQPKKEPEYITALVRYTEWTGTRRHLKRVEHQEVVYFRNGDKMIKTCTGNKRLSSLRIVKQVMNEKSYQKELD